MEENGRADVQQLACDGASADLANDKVRFHGPPAPERAVAEATGGLGNSCHRCLLALGVLAVLVGASVTGLAYGRDTHGSVLSLLGLTLLGGGLLALAASWAVRCLGRRQKLQREESFTELVGEGRAE
ncbi:transmembrane protein 100-like [Heptranchias perlo]|uniref:transmembrane protein 100-like n=1 Tax=Heptranchias perlo TaxID=212740 RepID=UPI00355A832D